MELLKFSNLQVASRRSLERTPQAGKAILLHTGVVALVSLVVSGLSLLLEEQIAGTGGLGGVQTRSLLSTIQSLLYLGQMIFLPFWQIGYLFFTLQAVRRQPCENRDLWEGFRRFWPVFRLKLLTSLIFLGLAIACSYISSILFMFTPWAGEMMEAMEPLMNSNMDDAALMEAMSAISYQSIIPMMALFLICFAAIAIPLFYRFRMAEYWLMYYPKAGAFASLRGSGILMRGNRMGMFKVDLHFWWFYGLELLIAAVCYGDLLLEALGVPLPMSSSMAYFAALVTSLALQVGLYWWRGNYVRVTYAHAFTSLIGARERVTV